MFKLKPMQFRRNQLQLCLAENYAWLLQCEILGKDMDCRVRFYRYDTWDLLAKSQLCQKNNAQGKICTWCSPMLKTIIQLHIWNLKTIISNLSLNSRFVEITPVTAGEILWIKLLGFIENWVPSSSFKHCSTTLNLVCNPRVPLNRKSLFQ